MNEPKLLPVVYLIHAGKTRLVKIGVSENPKRRAAQLQTSSPHKLELVKFARPWMAWSGGMEAFEFEEWCHRALSMGRQQGEWFEVPPTFCQWAPLAAVFWMSHQDPQDGLREALEWFDGLPDHEIHESMKKAGMTYPPKRFESLTT